MFLNTCSDIRWGIGSYDRYVQTFANYHRSQPYTNNVSNNSGQIKSTLKMSTNCSLPANRLIRENKGLIIQCMPVMIMTCWLQEWIYLGKDFKSSLASHAKCTNHSVLCTNFKEIFRHFLCLWLYSQILKIITYNYCIAPNKESNVTDIWPGSLSRGVCYLYTFFYKCWSIRTR